MENLYKGDYSPYTLGPGQFGPMTKRQAEYEAARQARKAIATEQQSEALGDFFSWLAGAGDSKRSPNLLDVLFGRIGPKK